MSDAAVERFRRLALSLPDAVEGSHLGTVDFRVRDRIFATLSYASRGQGTLKITPEAQAMFIADDPEHFEPVPGGWGRMGMTLVRLEAPEAVVAGALRAAYHQIAQKTAVRTRRGLKVSHEA